MTDAEVNDYLTRRYPRYLAIARRSCRDDVDDMAQEMLLAVTKALGQYPGKPDSYYDAVAKNTLARKVADHRLWTGAPRHPGRPMDEHRPDEVILSLDAALSETDEGEPQWRCLLVDEPGFTEVEESDILKDTLSPLPEERQEIARAVIEEGCDLGAASKRLGLARRKVHEEWYDRIRPQLRVELEEEKGLRAETYSVGDVAYRAGVSRRLVQFAVTEPGKVKDTTRERILRIADEIGWVHRRELAAA